MTPVRDMAPRDPVIGEPESPERVPHDTAPLLLTVGDPEREAQALLPKPLPGALPGCPPPAAWARGAVWCSLAGDKEKPQLGLLRVRELAHASALLREAVRLQGCRGAACSVCAHGVAPPLYVSTHEGWTACVRG